jgi:hypothetical protein
VALKVINWLPRAMQQDAVRRYKSVEEVRSALNMKDIYVPSYFPQQISWPPSSILAQSKPFTAIVMEFTRADKRNTALVISQSEGRALNVENPIEIRWSRKRCSTDKRQDSVLTVGLCVNDDPAGIT